MKTKIVLWGSNEKDEKLLIAVELLEKENHVRIHTFPAEQTTEAFYNQMMNLWRNGGKVIFPESHQIIDRNLSITEGLLPDGLKADRTDLLNRAKTEWHFVVLSAKLHDAYNAEIEEFKERIQLLSKYDSGIWEEMKGFWHKVQGQVREKNLFKEHAEELKANTNDLFSKMKELKKSLDEEFNSISDEHLSQFMEKLNKIEEKIESGLGLQPIFNELKSIQKKFRDTQFTRSDRSKVWKKLDNAFKKVKEKKFGSKANENSALDRIQRRYKGLISAIEKMKNSISRDKNEMEFQNKKIEATDGQLEMQIRQAKLSMITERIKSKEEKLVEMLKTKNELEHKIEIEEKKAARRKEKESQRKAAEEAKQQRESKAENKTEEVKTEISSETDSKTEPQAEEVKTEATSDGDSTSEHQTKEKEEVPKEEKEKYTEDQKKVENEESLLDAIEVTVGESLEDVVDTVKAVGSVLGKKISETVDSILNDDDEEE